MAIYSYIKINTGSPFGAELNPVKFNYTIIGEFEGRTYINTDDEIVPEQNKLIDFKLETENPIQKQKESVYTRLYRMGYDYSMITKVLGMLEYSSLDFERLEKDYLKIKSKEENQNKIIQKLLAKGYNYSDIKQVINNIEE